MKNIIKISIILLLIFNVFSVFTLIVQAADPVKPSTGLLSTESGNANSPIDPTTKKQIENCGNYTLNDMARTALKISNFILGIVGSLALLAFVAGGLMMMLSAGNAEWVTRGKQTIIGAVVGLAIVFTSYMIIQLVYGSLGLNWSGTSNFPTPTTGTPSPSTSQTQNSDTTALPATESTGQTSPSVAPKNTEACTNCNSTAQQDYNNRIAGCNNFWSLPSQTSFLNNCITNSEPYKPEYICFQVCN